MRIWGYILIFLNLIAGGAFVYFATQVWTARTEWQLAVVKQQLAIEGLPLEAPPPPPDLSDDSVPIDLQIGETRVRQIKKSILQKLIPNGGKALGSNTPVFNQVEEAKRVEHLVFQSFAPEKVKFAEGGKEFDLLTPEKRQRLAVTLISLSKGNLRMGIYALYRDLPVESRYEWAREDLKYLGRTTAQTNVLEALAAIGAANAALNEPPDVLSYRRYLARVAIAKWLRSEVPFIVPAPYRSPDAPAFTEDSPEMKSYKADLDILEGKLKPLIDPDDDNADAVTFTLPEAVERALNDYNAEAKNKNLKEKPIVKTGVLKFFPKGYLFKYSTDKDRADFIRTQIDAAVKGLRDVVGGDTGLKSESAATLIPFMVDLAANPLDTKEQIAAAKTRLLELMALRATSESEKRANAAIAEILFAPKPFKEESEDARAHREKNIDDAGLETLRAYFEEAEAKSSATQDLPQEPAQARAKIAGLKLIRDPDQKRRDIAHLLYHLDGYLALVSEDKDEKGNITRTIGKRVSWFKLMFPAIVEKDPGNEFLNDEEKKEAQAALDEVYKQRAEWHQRVAAIVGLKAYVPAIEAQATELSQITARLKPIIHREQGYYENERQAIVFRLLELNDRLEDLRRIYGEQEALKKEQEQQLELRQTEEAKLRQDLAKAQSEAKIALQKLDKKADELFKVTKKLGEAQDALLGLELQLREIELGRRQNK